MIRHYTTVQSRLPLTRRHGLTLLAACAVLCCSCALADEALWDELLEPPVAVAGQWQLSRPPHAPANLALQVSQQYGRITGQGRDGQVLHGTVDGHRVRFTLHCPAEAAPDCRATHYDGRLEGAYVRGQGNTGPFAIHLRREIILTFDDGPLPGATDKVLQALAELRTPAGTPVRAGFFFVASPPQDMGARLGNYAPFELWREKGSVQAHPELVRRVLHAGHYLGNHGAHHTWSWWPWQGGVEGLRKEIVQWEQIAQEAGIAGFSRVFRPPYLARIDDARAVAAQLGYHTLGGLGSGDAEPLATAESVQQRTLRALEYCAEPRCPLIFHDIRPVTQKHLGEVVRYLQRQGYVLADFAPPPPLTLSQQPSNAGNKAP